VGPLHHPAPRATKETAAHALELPLLGAQMQRESEHAGETADEAEVVALVEAHALAVVWPGRGRRIGMLFHGVREELAVISIRGSDDETDRDPRDRRSGGALGAAFARSVGLGRFFSPPSGALVMAPSIASQRQSTPFVSS